MRSSESRRRFDIESRVQPDDHFSLRLWLRLQSCSRLLEQRLREVFHAEFSTTPARFYLMQVLQRTPKGLQLGQLSQQLGVSGGNVTRMVEKLERDQLVVRVSDPLDRRSARARLTTRGARLTESLSARYETLVDEMLKDASIADLPTLFSLFDQLQQSVESRRDGVRIITPKRRRTPARRQRR